MKLYLFIICCHAFQQENYNTNQLECQKNGD
jgi:hypothetical protein